MTAPQPNTPLTTLLSGLKAKHVATEAAFEQLNKAVGDFLLGEPTDPEALHALVDRCECAYVDVATDADEAIRALLHVHAPLPLVGIEEPSDLEAFDQAVDRLACTEAQALAAFGVMDATVRQWVASIQTGDAAVRTAGFLRDALQALAIAKETLNAHQDAADDLVVTAGAVIGAMEQPHSQPACVAVIGAATADAPDRLSKFDAAVAEIETGERVFDLVVDACCREFLQRFPAADDVAWGRQMFALLAKAVHGKRGLMAAVGNVVFVAAESLSALDDRPAKGMTAAGVTHGNHSEA